VRPRLLDLFCGAGGAAEGYHRAGFDVVGVDINPQPHYPYEFIQGDALWALHLVVTGDWRFDAIHASPVCKRYSVATPTHARGGHPDQISPVRMRLRATSVPWVIENVPGAPLRPDFKLCGCMFGLPRLERERWFEVSWPCFELRQPCSRHGRAITVTGGGNSTGTFPTNLAGMKAAMGIDWMPRRSLVQAIPPAYTEHIGCQLMEALTPATT
jgi:DNA (cytosine-5)-methyltransferase 1